MDVLVGDDDDDYWEGIDTNPDPHPELRGIEDNIASGLGLDPEALQMFKTRNSELNTVLTDAEEEVMERAGVSESRLGRRSDEKDRDVTWVEVDGVPVYRAQFCYYHGGVQLTASWLPEGLLRLNAN